jgi:hypothetical protein
LTGKAAGKGCANAGAASAQATMAAANELRFRQLSMQFIMTLQTIGHFPQRKHVQHTAPFVKTQGANTELTRNS